MQNILVKSPLKLFQTHIKSLCWLDLVRLPLKNCMLLQSPKSETSALSLVFIHALYWLNMVKPLFLLAKPPPKKKIRVFLALFGASQPRSWLLWERQIKPSRRVSAKKGASRRTLSAMFGWNLAAMM